MRSRQHQPSKRTELDRLAYVVCCSLCLIAGLVAPTAAVAQNHLDEVVPEIVDSGDFLILRGDLGGIDAATVYLGDGSDGVRLEVVGQSDQEIVCRAPTVPRPLSGLVRLLPHDLRVDFGERTLERPGYTVTGRARLGVGDEVLLGDTVSILGPPDPDTSLASIIDGALHWRVVLPPCNSTIYVIVIEPETESDDPSRPCYAAEMTFAVEHSDPSGTVSDTQRAKDFVDLFNLSLDGTGLSSTLVEDPGAGPAVVIEHVGCDFSVVSLAVPCDDKNMP